MKQFNSILILCALVFIATLILSPMNASAQLREVIDGYVVTEADVDTAIEIRKLVSVQNNGTREENVTENTADIVKLIKKNKGNAAVFVTHRDSRATPDILITDAVIVRYLEPKEIEKRNSKAKKPPVLKKDSPLDPEPVLIKYKDVKFPYKIIGLLNVRSGVNDQNLSQQAMDYKMAEASSRLNATACLFVNYLRAGVDVSGASGIMVRAYDTWDEVEAIRKKDLEIEFKRKEIKAAQEKAEGK
jgi:hypothetical protein